MIEIIIGIIVLCVFVGLSIRIIRPTHRAIIERFGKYKRFAKPGLSFIIPFVERLIQVDITERMVDAEKQEIITKDRLNATVDAQVYFKVKPNEDDVKASQYNVRNYKWQIVNLARTTLRNIIGNLSYDEANCDRKKINGKLEEVLRKEAAPWGIELVRTELKEIEPPKPVQESMNEVIKAENDKKAAVDLATATETEADGFKRAAIKKAQGQREAEILEAEGIAKAIELKADAKAKAIKAVNEAGNKYFVGNAKHLKALEVTQASFENNSKIIVPEGSSIVNLVGDMAGMKIVPVKEESLKPHKAKLEPAEPKPESRRK
ncbi:unnamed protein product [marine sediment metagenome]|uniref:Band 7 domain-containing protein n=1 Tax=marine sediment metagenome TaxID=412755 RepID=X1RCQ7_9ZZZZ